ncbi:hypothetical protein [Nonomuraea coxensis]|uniref:hypothetical protein n=1 Tax=Nonomuraea coxensis TaxID=404386 RepID=UPI001FE3CBFA|nr:hypothetical protein [Nonomuraea coxensis]
MSSDGWSRRSRRTRRRRDRSAVCRGRIDIGVARWSSAWAAVAAQGQAEPLQAADAFQP